jgi:Calcineurin-like phosphoesterase
MKRIGVIALVLWAGLAFALGAQAKPKHQPLKCKAGYTSRFLRIPKRVHGRIVRRHGRIVYIKVQRCVKTPKPKPSSPAPPLGGTLTTPQPPGTPTVPSPTTTTTAPPPGAPVNMVRPTISGSATAGSTLSASTGTWANAPTSYGYQWQRCNTGACQNVGAPASTYLLGSSDVGSTVLVSVTAGNASGSGSATSAPTGTVASSGGSSGDPVVVAVGDIARPPGCNPCEQSATASLTQTFSPASVLVLGDNQYDSGSDSEYTGSYDLTWGHDFNAIVHPVLGNHEYLTSGAAGYFQYFGDHGVTTNAPAGYYSVNLGAWHIVSLNSNCSDQKGCSDALAGGTTSAEMSWLQSDLAANRSACVLAMWHHPLFSYGWTLGAPSVAPLWTALYNAHADVVLNGHDHLYERYAPQDPSGTASTAGIREFVVGTGGESLNGLNGSTLPATLQANDREYGVLVLTLHATRYDWKFVNTSGTTRDSGTTACHGSGASTAAVGSRRRAAPIDTARLAGPPLTFDARPLAASLKSVRRTGLTVAVHASRAVDVVVTAWLRHGHRLTRLASFYETESQITKPHSVIRLRLPTRRLWGTGVATLVLRFAAEDGAGHRHTVTRTVRLG